MKSKPLTKYESLHYLLGQYGDDKMTREEFWRQMNARGYTQACIDEWCEQFHQLEAKREQDDEERKRRKEEQGRTSRATTAGYARGARGEEQGIDRPEREDDWHRTAQRSEDQGQGQGAERGRQDQGASEGQGGAVQGEAGPNWEIIDGEIWVTLTPEMIAWVDRIARERWQIAQDVGADNEGRDPEAIWLNKRDGYRAEMAARRFFGLIIPWSINKPVDSGKQKIDFSDFIDVKHRPRAYYDLNVDLRTFHRDHAYLLVCGESHPHYRIVGWCWGHEIGTPERRKRRRPDRDPPYAMSEDDPLMKSPLELLDLALARVKR
jgi:hypothetical protein